MSQTARPTTGALVAYCYNSNRYYVRPLFDDTSEEEALDDFREEHWHCEYQSVNMEQVQGLYDLLTPVLEQAETPDTRKRLSKAFAEYAKATSDLSELIGQVMGADLSYWASEGYPDYLPSFDEFACDIAIWAEAQKEVL
ncbi:MAG: hypothetical protein ACREOP_06295 [Thermodesulfobacteriota bacterium]